jgi:hypothetical protein
MKGDVVSQIDLNTIHLEHSNIKQNNIWFKILNDINCLEPIDRFAYDLNILFTLEDQAQAFTNEPVIVGDYNPDLSFHAIPLKKYHGRHTITNKSLPPFMLTSQCNVYKNFNL